MKNIKLYIGLLATALISLSSCKNDLDVLAPGEETVSVYGVLNPNESVQNIRINKVYLTNGDVLAAGQNADQINYGAGELEVSLERYLDGTQMNVNTLNGVITSGSPDSDKRIVLTETVVTTSSGLFNTNQRIWQTNKKLFVAQATSTKPNPKTEYKLKIKIIKTGREITSQATLIDSVKPYSSMPFIYVINSNPQFSYPMHCGYILDVPAGTGTKQVAYVDYSNLTATSLLKIKFKSIANAKLYDVVMRFHYKNISFGDDTTAHYVDFNFATLKSSSLVGGDPMEVSFKAVDFYRNLASEIAKKNQTGVKTRVSHYMEYIIYSGDENLNTFLQVNQPSNTIAQDKPNYTNINGGVGIFACRSKSSITKELWSEFIDEISNNSITNSLLFNKNYTFICP